MQATLHDQVAIVTGGGFNIGRAIALRLAALGATIVATSRNRHHLEVVAGEIVDAGGRAAALPCDVTDLHQVESMVEETVGRFARVDIVVNAAGGAGDADTSLPIDAVDPDEWHRVVATNLGGTFHVTRAALPHVRESRRGRIVTCAGGGAFFPTLGAHLTAYACAKAAICRFTDQLQAELLHTSINVNCIEPGLCWSPDRLASVEAEERRTGAPHPEREHNHSPEAAADMVETLVTAAGDPIRGRILAVDDTWWKIARSTAEVTATVHRFRLRRDDRP